MVHYVWFRRILLFGGIALGLWSPYVVDFLPLSQFLQNRAQNDLAARKILGFSILYVLLFSLLAQVVSWGLKRGWTWSLWGGRFCSVVLLVAGMPWLTPFGVYGLYALRTRPEQPAVVAKRTSGMLLGALRSITGFATLVVWGIITTRSRDWNLPAPHLGSWVFAVWIAGELPLTALHELGHALLAKAVGFRLQAICIGPLTLWKNDLGRRQILWNWRALLGEGGYIRGIPVSAEHVRSNMILVVLAGPLSTLLVSLALVSATMAVRGTSWAGWWEVLAALALLFLVSSVHNLIPMGLNDGGMLFSLILWNKKGRQLVDDLTSGKLHEDSASLRREGDLEGELRMLQRALFEAEAGRAGPDTMFMRRLQLGFACLRSGEREQAEEQLTGCLKLAGKIKQPNPSYAANIWMGLHGVYRLTERREEATRAYESAIASFAEVLQLGPRVPELAAIRNALATLHVTEDHFEKGLEEIGRALPYFQHESLKRAALLCHQAEAEFNLGFAARGLAAVAEAEGLIRAELGNETSGRLAIAHLAVLADAALENDDMDRAIELLREVVERYEAAGLPERAIGPRINLAGLLRRKGKPEEAAAILDGASEVPPRFRADFLLVRGRIHHLAEDIEEAERLAVAEHGGRKVLLATIWSDLAEQYQFRGRLEEARAKAEAALGVLRAAGHLDEVDALVTLALLGEPERFSLALETLATTPKLRWAQKARAFDALANRMEEAGFSREAERFRQAAQAQRVRFELVS